MATEIPVVYVGSTEDAKHFFGKHGASAQLKRLGLSPESLGAFVDSLCDAFDSANQTATNRKTKLVEVEVAVAVDSSGKLSVLAAEASAKLQTSFKLTFKLPS